MRRPAAVLCLLAAITAASVVVGLGACKRKQRAAGPGRVTILYTGGVQGALEPCGCSPGQLGGVARAATLVKQIREESPSAVLVDAGDLLLQDPAAPPSIRPQLILKAKSMQKAYGAMHAAVLNLGGKDAAAGADVAVSGARAIGAAPVSANLRDARRKPLAPGSAVIEAGGVRVAFVGVAREARREPRPPVDAVRASVADAGNRADVVVLLSTLGIEAARDLVSKIPGIDLVIDAGESQTPRNIVIPQKAGNAHLVSVKPLGEFVGRIDITVNISREQPLRDVTTSDRIEGMPGGGAPSGALFGGGVDLRGLSPKRSKASAKLPPLAPGTFRHRVYALGDTIKKDAAMQHLLVDYKREVADLTRHAPVTRARIPTTGPRYVGEEACKACHKAISDFVATTLHARAYPTLERVHSEYDLECVGCHVTGWQKPGGFDQPRAVGNLKGVQCEVCHGPGSEHVAAGGRRGVGGVRAQVPAGLCETCHTPVHSTRFAGKEKLYEDQIRCSRAPGRGAPGVAPEAAAKTPHAPP